MLYQVAPISEMKANIASTSLSYNIQALVHHPAFIIQRPSFGAVMSGPHQEPVSARRQVLPVTREDVLI
jgi:hypothetical protein